MRNAKNDADGAGSKIGGAFKTLGKVTLAGLGAAAAGVGALTKSAVSSYAEYEQLVGGAQKIFDDMDYSAIAKDASEAYKTMNLSASEYLSMMNDVGATFAQTMGDKAGYEAAKTGMKAISDYASGTGKNVGELSAKFSMITRSTASYQSIADQFSGILPATSAGFLEQAQAAGILSDSYKNLTEVPIDEYQAAVSQMLAKGVDDLNLTDNAMHESTETITGSLAATKAAWHNLVTGIADDNADFGKLIDDFVESAGAVGKNLLPRISTALKGVGKLVTGLAPQIAEALPILIEDVVPALLESATQFVMTLGQGIVQNLPLMLSAALEVILALANGIAKNLPTLIPTIVDVVLQIVDTLIDNVDMLVEAALQIMIALAGGLIKSLPTLLAKAPEIIASLVKAIIGAVGQLAEAAGSIISTLASGIASRFSTIIGKGKELLQAFKNGVVSAVGSLASAGLNLVQGIWNGISNGLGWIKSKIQGWVGNVTSFIKSLFGIHSPSTVMRDQVGKFLALGIGEGFTREMTSVEKMMQNSMPDLTSNIDVNGNYNGYGYGSGAFGGMAINGDVYITVEGAGKNAEEIGRDLYKMLVNKGVSAYAY